LVFFIKIKKINSFIKITGDITYDNEASDTKKLENILEKGQTLVKNNGFTELDNLTKQAVTAKTRDYFNNPILNLDNFGKMSFLQIENIYINNIRQW